MPLTTPPIPPRRIQRGTKLGTSKPRTPNLLMRVWDAPTRLFHWVIVLLIAFSYVSIERDWTQLHFLSGYTILALLGFRLVWGFVGSETSRFSQFVRHPVEGLRHLAQFRRREPDTEIGHNAAGGWMVLMLLGAIAAQVTTGLFSNADGLIDGPLAHHLARKTSDWVTGLHATLFYVLLGLTGLHIVAILAYAAVKRHNLVGPMITGRKRLPANLRQPRFASPVLALGVTLASGAAVWLLVQYG